MTENGTADRPEGQDADMPTRGSQVASEHIIAAYVLKRLNGRTEPSEIESAVREAVRAHGNRVPSSLLPERPVEVVVQIADEDSIEVDQTLHLTRDQAARPELLGGAVGHATASALAGFYVADDGSSGDDAREAAATALDAR